jgi:hypothetical protein
VAREASPAAALFNIALSRLDPSAATTNPEKGPPEPSARGVPVIGAGFAVARLYWVGAGVLESALELEVATM